MAITDKVRLPSSELKFYCLIAPIDPNDKPNPSLAPNTQLAGAPEEFRWTVFMSNGEWIGDDGEAVIELPWPGHYAVIPYIADAKDELSRMRFLPRWLPIVVKDEPGQRYTVEVTQDRIDAAVKEFLGTDSKPGGK